MAFADSQYTCAKQAQKLIALMCDQNFVRFLEEKDRKPLVEQMFPKEKFDSITREELPTVVKAKQDEAKAIEEEKARKVAKEQAEAEERKERMKQSPPNYKVSGLNEFSMMISDEKLQEARKKLEETEKAGLAEKIAKKRPVAYLPEAKEPAELSPLEMNPNYIPIPNIQALFPFCSSQHKAFFSLCKFLTENRDLERQICEVCEQIVNCFGKAQCPVTKIKGGLVIFQNEAGDSKRVNAFEVYINDRYRAIFIKNLDGDILFTHFGVHTI